MNDLQIAPTITQHPDLQTPATHALTQFLITQYTQSNKGLNFKETQATLTQPIETFAITKHPSTIPLKQLISQTLPLILWLVTLWNMFIGL